MTAIASLFDAMTLLITRRERPGEGGLPLPAGADVVVLRQPAGSDLRRKLSVAASLIYYLRTIARHVRQADVVHVPLPGDIPFLGMLVALALRKRLIARYGGSWVANRQTTLMNRVTRMLMRRFAGGRNVMLATGEGETPPAPGMRWIFATALSAEELRAIRPIPDRGLSDPPRIVYIGRLSPEKGVAHLIEAVALLDREGFRPLPEVVLIGSGPERASLEAQVEESGYLRRVRFAGQLDRAGLSAELQRADLCVQPSLTEGFSKAWLDAFAHGLPVLASEVGAARSVIGTNGERGWLAPPGDVRVLARQIRCILTEATDWPALRRRCIAFAQERTLDAWAREIGQVCAKQWNMALVEGRIRSARVMG
jgi:glycosyltransferase involved in cell wall biosynthesis